MSIRKSQSEKMSGFLAWQLRAARAAADLSIQQLADLSGVSVSSIRRAEQNGSTPMSRPNQKALLDALEAKGVHIDLPADGSGAVSMRTSALEPGAASKGE